jgi:hypothetical protein
MKFIHFIITQFNLRNFPISDHAGYEKWVEWTRNRTDLFMKFCLPSVINQTCRDFTWLLFFDSETPAEFDEFSKSLETYNFINVCHSDGIDDFNTGYFEEIKKRLPENTEWIITTRIDNDDALHRDAVKTIQQNFTAKHKYLISLASGYILNTSDNRMSHYYYPMSPFISLIENAAESPAGVFEKGHTRWDALRLFIFREIWHEFFRPGKRRSRFILKKPMWIQTVHGRNVSNSFIRGLPVMREIDSSDFSLDFRNKRQTIKEVPGYFNYVMWKRYFKCLIIKTIIGK